MPDRKTCATNKLMIASEFLTTASILWLNETGFFSAMHLAAAAEEITGKACRILRRRSNHDEIRLKMIRALTAVGVHYTEKEIRSAMYAGKNAIKHMNSEADRLVAVDAREEASEFISAACRNFQALGLAELIPDPAKQVQERNRIVIEL